MISDKVAWISSLVTLISERVAAISVLGASFRYAGEGVSIDGTAISDKVARIRSLVRLIRDRCCHVNAVAANVVCRAVEKV